MTEASEMTPSDTPASAAKGEALTDLLDDWIVNGLRDADRRISCIGPINACTPEDQEAGRLPAYQVGYQNGVKATLTDASFIMARAQPHPSQPSGPHCQLCGGNVEGWTCQTCEAEFEEVAGLLVLRSEKTSQQAGAEGPLREEAERMVKFAQALCDAADHYGIKHLDSDDMDDEAVNLQAATLAMRHVLADVLAALTSEVKG